MGGAPGQRGMGEERREEETARQEYAETRKVVTSVNKFYILCTFNLHLLSPDRMDVLFLFTFI